MGRSSRAATGRATGFQNALMILSLIGSAVGAPFWGGLILMGIRHSVDIPTKAADIFDGFSRAGPLIATLLATSIITQLGLLLGQLHWGLVSLRRFILAWYWLYALPLVVERGITPLNAIYYSLRIVHYKLPQFILLLFVVIMGWSYSVRLCPFGLIFVVPLIFNLVGVVYKETVGVTIKLDKPQSQGDEYSPWTA